MKIAFFVSSNNIIPPVKTGGVEYSVYYLIRELARRGHKITLYAAPGSRVDNVKTRKMAPLQISEIKLEYANLKERITGFYDLTAMADFFQSGEWKKYDLIHYNNYLFYEILPFARMVDIPIIVRINYPHDKIYPYIKDRIKEFQNVYYLPVSDFIKTTMPGLNYLDPVYPVIDMKDFSFSKKTGEYLLFMGRICPEKGAHVAIEAAQKAGKPLVIAGDVSPSHYEYFNSKIKPYIDNKNVTYVGEVDFKTKIRIYQKAIATLFPIRWEEPFGIVLLESMACGTPIITFDRAAIKEIIKDGNCGIIVKDGDVDGMARAVKAVLKLDRKKTRKQAEKYFSISGQADKYEIICRQLVSN